jgi:hypothetical protein
MLWRRPWVARTRDQFREECATVNLIAPKQTSGQSAETTLSDPVRLKNGVKS